MGDGNPWINADGDFVHPNAPNGGGGKGYFKSAAPLGTDLCHTSDLPHPLSRVGLNTASQFESKFAGLSLVNNQAFQSLVEAMESDADEADQQWKSNVRNDLVTF